MSLHRRAFIQNSLGFAAPFILTGKLNLNPFHRRLVSDAPTYTEFQTIAREFADQQNLAGYLPTLGNKKLAETLVLHRDLVEQEDLTEDVQRQMYMHYVINTKGNIPDEGLEIGPWVRQYADLLNLDVDIRGTGAFRGIVVKRGRESFQPNLYFGDKTTLEDLRLVGQFCNRCKYGRDDVIPSLLFSLDASSRNHSLSKAMWMSEFSSMAYFERAYIDAQVSGLGYTFNWIDMAANARHDTQCFVASRQDHTIVCFRGTSSFRDLITDAKFRKKRARGYPGKIHKGFREALDEVWAGLRHQLRNHPKDRPMFVTGHSLGAALAQLAAYRLKKEGYPVEVYLFGSPKTGDCTFAQAYDALLAEQTYVHINNRDAVTRIPPFLLGFRNVGNHFFRFDESHNISYNQENESESAGNVEEQDLYEAAQQSFNDATSYLSPWTIPGSGVTYDTSFGSGLIEDHGIGQYLFKFACGIVEEKYEALGLD